MNAVGGNFFRNFFCSDTLNFFPHVEILHKFSLTQSAALTDIQNLSFFFSIFNLHLGVATVIFPSCASRPAQSFKAPYQLNCRLLPSWRGNTAVTHVQQQAKAGETKKRGAYNKLNKMTKIRIAKYSSKNGISAAARRFLIELGRNINPSTVRGFKRAYMCTSRK